MISNGFGFGFFVGFFPLYFSEHTGVHLVCKEVECGGDTLSNSQSQCRVPGDLWVKSLPQTEHSEAQGQERNKVPTEASSVTGHPGKQQGSDCSRL